MSDGNCRKKRYRQQIPRLSAQEDTPLGFALWYLNEYPLDIKEAVSNYIRHAYFVRALRALKGKEPTAKDRSFINSEAWQSIWYFWSLIEGVCAYSDVSFIEVVERLTSESSEGQGTNSIRISDLANLMANRIEDISNEENGSELKEPGKDSSPKEGDELAKDKERISHMSSMLSPPTS